MSGPALRKKEWDWQAFKALLGTQPLPVVIWRFVELRQVATACKERAWQGPMLDLGCGDGAIATELFERVDVGIDRNEEVLASAQRTRTYGALVRADARQLPFADASFGCVFSNCVLEHITPLPQAIAEVSRVLKPGGVLIATVPDRAFNTMLTLRVPWYVRLRNRQLAHMTVEPLEHWAQVCAQAGLKVTCYERYFTAAQTRRWDAVEFWYHYRIVRFVWHCMLHRVFPGLASRWGFAVARAGYDGRKGAGLFFVAEKCAR